MGPAGRKGEPGLPGEPGEDGDPGLFAHTLSFVSSSSTVYASRSVTYCRVCVRFIII